MVETSRKVVLIEDALICDVLTKGVLIHWLALIVLKEALDIVMVPVPLIVLAIIRGVLMNCVAVKLVAVS